VHTRLLPSVVRPIGASLKLTENCQAKCVTCDYWKTRWEDGLSTERAVETINRLSDFGIRYLRFTGGEPLLRRDLFEILRRADTSRFKRISLQTNGLLLKKLHKEINESPINKVSVSIDGLEATNDAIRGTKEYFRLAFEGLQLLQGKSIQVAATLNRRSSEELQSLVDLVTGYGYEFAYNLLDNHLYFFRNGDVESLWPKEDDIERIGQVLEHKLKRPAYEIKYVKEYFRRSVAAEPPCAIGFLEVYVASNGDVMSGCYVLAPVGNLLKQDLGEIILSKAYKDRCVSMTRRECPGCTCGVLTSLRIQNVGQGVRVLTKGILSRRRAAGESLRSAGPTQ